MLETNVQCVSYPFPVSKQDVYCSYLDLILLHFACQVYWYDEMEWDLS